MRLFVGQIPREWTENNIKMLFSKYGELQEITILRHQDTLISKGCAFVTFVNDSSALMAIEELHDKFSPSEGRKIQVRDSCAPRQNGETGRLYCSNLAETTTGNQVFDLFSEVGKVLSVSILTNAWNQSKCSCLVEMATKSDANAVIEAFNGKLTLANAVMPISVSWARNTGSKNRSNSSFSSQTPFSAGSQPTPYPVYQQTPMYPYYDPNMQYYQTAMAPPPVMPTSHPQFSNDEEEKYDENLLYSPPPQMPVMPAYAYAQPMVFFAVPYPSLPPSSPLVHNKMLERHFSSNSLYSAGGGGSPMSQTRYREGPQGANVFVKNFPYDWESKDLQSLFESFGEIVSCHVFTDRLSGKSKGFGFVSYSKRESAEAAIQQLNGKLLEKSDEPLIVEHKIKDHSLFSTQSSSVNLLENLDDVDEELRQDQSLFLY